MDSRIQVDGAEGFEPPNTGTKNQCLTAWPRPKSHPSFFAYVDGIIAQKIVIVKRYGKNVKKTCGRVVFEEMKRAMV